MDEYKPVTKDKPEPVAKTKKESKPKKTEKVKVVQKTEPTKPVDSKPKPTEPVSKPVSIKPEEEPKVKQVEQTPIEPVAAPGPQPIQKIDLSQIEKMSREHVDRKKRIRRTKSRPADIESIGIMLEDITYSIDQEIRQDARALVSFSNIPENQLKIAQHILELVNKKITLLGK